MRPLLHPCSLAAPLSLMVCLLLVHTPAPAEQLGAYAEGSLSFHYQQWPFGSFSGDFSATGTVLDTTGWQNGQTESCGGSISAAADSFTVWGYGATLNADSTTDLAGIWVRTVGAPQPGNYAVDMQDFTAGFIFFDNISGFTPPADSTDPAAWLDGIVADHKFAASGGSIQVSAVADTVFLGSFSGSMVDPNTFMIISVSGGSFDFTGPPLPTAAPLSGTASLADHSVHPSPFSGHTRIRFSLDAPSHARVSIFDVSGRQVAVLFDRAVPEGEHSAHWSGMNAEGFSVQRGLYFYRIQTGQGTVASGKVVRAP